MEAPQVNEPGNIPTIVETEKIQTPDLSKVFNSPHIQRGVIQCFGLNTEEAEKFLHEYEYLGEPISASLHADTETEDEYRKRELLKYAFDEGASSKRYLRDSNGEILDYDDLNLTETITSKAGGQDQIMQIESLDKLSELIGTEILYEKRTSKIISNEEADGFEKHIVSKTPLFNVTVSSENGSLKTINDVDEEMLNMWSEMGESFFGKAPSNNCSIEYIDNESISKDEALQKLTIYGQMAMKSFAYHMVDMVDAVYKFPTDPDTNKAVETAAHTSLDATYKTKSYEQPNDLHLIKINILLAPYLGEVKTAEDYRKWSFKKDVPNSVIQSTLKECEAIITDAKEKELRTKQQEVTTNQSLPEKPRSNFQKFLDGLRAKK